MTRFIDPKTLARIKEMPLLAKTVAEGFLQGMQQSRQKGVGIEFSQYRGYEPGDPLGQIDWKLFARADRYYVRQAERESEMTLFILLDASDSMAVSGQPNSQASRPQSEPWTKLTYGCYLAATLAYLAQKQGDRVGLLGLASTTTVQAEHFVPADMGERHWQRIMVQLSRLNPAAKTGADRPAVAVFPQLSVLKHHLERLQTSAMVVIISDFYQRNNEITDFIKQIGSRHNELVAMQLQSAAELSFPYRGVIRFQDLETQQQVKVNGQAIKAHYLQALAQYQATLKQALNERQATLVSLSIDEPMDQGLYHYLKQRQRLVR